MPYKMLTGMKKSVVQKYEKSKEFDKTVNIIHLFIIYIIQ
jgi:hypothetical protein